MEPTGLRDVFKCITLSIAAMEDIGLHPKPSNDPPVHRPTVTETFGLHHIPPDPLQVGDASRKSDGASNKRSHSVMTAQPQMIPQFPSPNAAAKNGNTRLVKAGADRKKPKAKHADPSKWKQNKQKQLRMEGKAYASKRKKDGELVTKQPRAVGPRCTSNACKKASNRLCNEIDEEARKRVFDEFWKHMNWSQRKQYVAGQVDCDPVERSRAAGSQSRRSVSLRYHLVVDGKRKQVCKNMFLTTLGIGEWSVLNWAQKAGTKNSESNENRPEKRQAVPQGPRQNPSSSTVGNTVEDTQEPEGPPRKKSRVARPLTWKQNRQKQLRMEGKSYVSKRKKDGITITKAQRAIGPRCTSSACKRASNRFCADFSEEMRDELFTTFWQRMNWPQRKIHVAELVDCDPVERTRAPWTQSRRSVSMRYHLLAGSDRRQVCKKMFLSTLGVGEWSVLNWAQNSSKQDDSAENGKRQTQRKSRKASEHVFLKEFLESLPKVPSYCCGTAISKLYLEPVFSNMSEVYRHYYNHCLEKTKAPLSRQVFCAVFKKMDLGLCDPKKDQGCSFGATGNLFNELWEEYCLERGAAGPSPEKTAAPGDPWGHCPVRRECKGKFGNGVCNKECMEPECLRDGFDCENDRGPCNPAHIQYCRDHYGNSHCEQGCDSAPCGWDGSDCFKNQSPVWAKGTLVFHTRIPHQRGTFTNSSLLWAASVLLQSPVILRGSAPLATEKNLFDLDHQQLANTLTQASADDSDGSLLFLQVDNRPCSRLPSTCFPYATEAASFLNAVRMRSPPSFSSLPKLTAVIDIRGVREEIGNREEETVKKEVKEPTPAWIWAVIAITIGLLLVLPLLVFLVVRRVRQRRAERGSSSSRVRHRSTVTDNDPKSKALVTHAAHQEQRVRSSREKDKISLRKKKKAKEAEKRRREPLGEDAIRMRPLKRDQDIGSDTDFTQSSMEDISARCSRRQEDASICDHRTQEQKHYRAGGSQPHRAIQPPPRGWERTAMPPPLLSPPQQSAEWCGPDGSVVLIRAVRSGLDRVVLELLRAGVPVNNTDHTGRSALHWASSVNHLSLTRTLIRYGAAVDLQDNKGETALFLSAVHGCYDTARLLLLHGANLELHDRRGRRPIDMAREGMHHQVMELLLAHQIQRGPVAVESTNDMMWEERALMYSPWVGSQGLPGRSASFSGIIAHRDMTPPPQNDWSMSRVQYPAPQNWRPQLNQSATALVPPRIMGRSPRPISTLQEVTSEDEDRDRHHQEVPRAATPHFLSPQPAPRQRSFSCTQHALQRRSSNHQPEPNYIIVTDRTANEPIERVVVSPPTDAANQPERPPVANGSSHSRAEHTAVSSVSSEQKSRGERLNNAADSTQTAL